MKKLFATTTLLLATSAICAQPVSVFSEALEAGSATAPFPTNGMFAAAGKAIRERSGNGGEVLLSVWRIERFTQQSNCGRVAFIPVQAASNMAFPEMGGELNICADGMPPLRECPSLGLVPATAKCSDGKPSRDTREVAEAIAKAASRGGLTHTQVLEKLKSNRERAK